MLPVGHRTGGFGTHRCDEACHSPCTYAFRFRISKEANIYLTGSPQYAFLDSIKAFEAVNKGKGEDGKTTIKVQISQGKAQT